MDERKLAEAIATEVEAALGNLKVDSETHFKHHEAVEGWIKWTANIKKTFWTGLVMGLAAGLLGIVWLGVVTAMKLKGALIG